MGDFVNAARERFVGAQYISSPPVTLIIAPVM